MEENPAPVDRSLLIPLAIGVIAIVGICFVLLALRLGAAPGSVQTTPSATPVKYLYLGTEPVVVEPTDLPTPTLAAEPTPSEAVLSTEIVSPETSSTVIVLPEASTNTLVATNSTVANGTPTASGVSITVTGATTTAEISTTYDDVSSLIVYTGNWAPQTGLANTYQNTLHVSGIIGEALKFTFYGEKFQFVYQTGPTLGAVAIRLDTPGQESVTFALDQSASATSSGQWESPTLTIAYHTITITHISGGSTNIDAAILFTLPTPTPTVTPTITRTVGP